MALQGVDTRLKALQPGTTLGDIAYSSATANVNTRLGVGTNGQVLAVSGGVPAWTTTAGSDFAQLGQTVLTSTQATISFPSISSAYTNLRVVWSGKSSSADQDLFMRFNSDTGASYDNQYFYATGTLTGANETFAATKIVIGLINTVNSGGAIVIPAYSKTVLDKFAISTMWTKRGTSSTNMQTDIYGGTRRNTAAITQIDFTCSGGDFQIGTVFTLYGEK